MLQATARQATSPAAVVISVDVVIGDDDDYLVTMLGLFIVQIQNTGIVVLQSRLTARMSTLFRFKLLKPTLES